ncbi:hypothetical protein A9Q96_02300 [Rhodobacterales bacterium 52_120_T64]|nr:hypothetical protein A9Q96_02300 [Rhodobacterales bacterium 52_120_T64]
MSNTPSDITLGGFDSFERKLGDELRGERATMGKSLLDVQRELRVKAAYISAIENCDVSVFPNASFVAGYVRSYARYLELDPEVTFARFCVEARFQSASVELGGTPTKKKKTSLQPITDPQSWTPNMPGNGVDGRSGTAGATVAAAGPAVVLAAVVAILGYGAWFVLQDIQRVEFAPIEDNPMVAFEPDNLGGASLDASDGFLASSIELAADPSILYSRRELDIPVVQPRDGPIFAINPDAENDAVVVTEETDLVETEVVVVIEGSPRVSETPYVPTVSVVAVQEAWVRVYQENGTILFEKILAAGEQYSLPRDAPTAYLRAGNATAVYLMIDDDAYGPLSDSDSVVRDIALLPTSVADTMTGVAEPSVALQVAAEAWRSQNLARLSQ